MPLTREQRTDAYRLYQLIGERDMPSNNTAARLVQRSSLPAKRVQAAIDFLWADDSGFIRADTNPDSGEMGYFVDPKCKKKTPMDLDLLWNIQQENLADKEDGGEDDGEDEDEDEDEWNEMDEEDPDED